MKKILIQYLYIFAFALVFLALAFATLNKKDPNPLENIEQRLEESRKIKDKYPDRIPIICEKSASSKLPNVDKTK